MSEGADQDSKTEEPTGKRLSEARGEGNLAISREMSAWFLFVALWLVLKWFGPILAGDMQDSLRLFLEKPHEISVEGSGLQNAMMGVIASVVFPAILVFGGLLVMSILGTMLQSNWYVGTGKLKMKFDQLMPQNGIKRLFSMNSVSELVKSFFKLVVLGYVCYLVLKPVFLQLPHIVELNVLTGLEFLHSEALHLLIILMTIITVIAVADILYVRYQYFKGLRMTKQEVKDEHKQMEGDPVVKNRIRSLRIEKARRRMMAKVPNASVIITNPTHYAVALEYDSTKMMAPVLVAKGLDRLALRIREVGEENEVPLVSNPPLARTLHDNVDLDEPIQPEHYRAVAEIISYVYKMKKKGIKL